MDADFLLIQKIKKGNEQAMDQFVSKHYPKIYQYCLLRVRDHGYAEDLTQETFLKFFQAFERYKHYGKVLNYLYVIAGNLCKDHFRKKGRMEVSEMPEEIAVEHMGQVEKRMEIEGAAYYSLRQICMARILLFGFMDLLIVTVFAVSVAFTVRVSAQMFTVNFLIPFNVTGAICFRFLYCKRSESEYLAAAGCFLFMILWIFIISREEIYCKISGVAWCAALILSMVYLIYVIKRSQNFYGAVYEV